MFPGVALAGSSPASQAVVASESVSSTPLAWPTHASLVDWIIAHPNRLLRGTYQTPTPTARGKWHTITIAELEVTSENPPVWGGRAQLWLAADSARDQKRTSAWLDFVYTGRDAKLDLSGRVMRLAWKPHQDGGQGQLVLRHEYFGGDLVLDTAPMIIPPITGCPIAAQPTTSLALVCRFLTASELLATYQASKQLSFAASHPLTFQHGVETGLEATRTRCFSFTHGPSITFSRLDVMKAALRSRLVQHFRIMHLRPQECDFSAWMQQLSQPTAPKLRALTIEIDSTMGVDAACLRDAPSLAYLTMVHITAKSLTISTLVPHLPRSVDLLHITFMTVVCLDTEIVDALVGPDSGVTKLIFDLGSQYISPSRTIRLEDMLDLERLAVSPRIEQLHWRVPFNLDVLQKFHDTSPAATALPFTTARVSVLELTTSGVNRLALLPQVERLIVDAARISDWTHPSGAWPDVTRKCLRELTIWDSTELSLELTVSLAAAGLGNLRVLELSADPDKDVSNLEAMFRSMPLLTELQLPIIPDFASFHLLAHLTTLRVVQWPKHFAPSTSVTSQLPTLTSLQVAQGEKWSPPLPMLHSIVNLRRLQWVIHPWMALHELEPLCASHHAGLASQRAVETQSTRAATPQKAVPRMSVEELMASAASPDQNYFKKAVGVTAAVTDDDDDDD